MSIKKYILFWCLIDYIQAWNYLIRYIYLNRRSKIQLFDHSDEPSERGLQGSWLVFSAFKDTTWWQTDGRLSFWTLDGILKDEYIIYYGQLTGAVSNRVAQILNLKCIKRFNFWDDSHVLWTIFMFWDSIQDLNPYYLVLDSHSTYT